MIWFVHRAAGPGTPITSAHEDHMPGYNDEQLDDTTNAEMKAYRTLVTTPSKPGKLDNLIATLATKGVISAQDQSGL